MAAFVLSTPIDSLRCGSMEEALETKASQNIGLVAVWLREVA